MDICQLPSLFYNRCHTWMLNNRVWFGIDRKPTESFFKPNSFLNYYESTWWNSKLPLTRHIVLSRRVNVICRGKRGIVECVHSPLMRPLSLRCPIQICSMFKHQTLTCWSSCLKNHISMILFSTAHLVFSLKVGQVSLEKLEKLQKLYHWDTMSNKT